MSGPGEPAGTIDDEGNVGPVGGVPYRLRTVPVDGGELTVGEWGTGGDGPLLLAVHGITSSHLAWAVVGERLGVDHRLVAVDLRGRGGSRDLPGPYGMARHAADLVRVIEAYGGGPVVLLGHSMGGFVAVELARTRPELVRRLVLVDGGALLPAPPDLDPSADEQTITALISATVGPAFDRLTMTFPDREAYRTMWRQHPSFADWTPAVRRYVDYDLVGTEPRLHPSCRLEAAVRDARDQYAYPGIEPAPLPVPTVFLRAPRGMLNEPDKPLYPAGYAAHRLPGVVEQTVPGVNHYTIALGDSGAAAIEAAVRTGG